MELLVIMELILTVVVWIVLATVTGEYAKRKGHEKSTWILVAVLLSPLVAFIILLAFRTQRAGTHYLRSIQKVPQCAEKVRADAKLCQ